MAKYKRVTTPTGIASYPWLKEPDTSFVKDGQWSCNIFVEKSAAKALIKSIDDEYNENVKATKKETGQDKIKPAPKPYVVGPGNVGKLEVGADQVLFKIKSKARIGDTQIRPAVVDADGKPVSGIDIYGGSEVRVAMDMVPYYIATTGAGVTLRLIGVQILTLQEKPAPDINSLGFKKEDGFKVSEHEIPEVITGNVNENQNKVTEEDFI